MINLHLKNLLTVKFVLLILTSMVFQGATIAASFDCTKARSFAEKSICSNNKLGNLDVQMAELYKEGLGVIGPSVRSEQREWLKTVRACKDELCLEKKYQVRIDELSEFIQQVNRQRCLEKGETYAMGACQSMK